MHGFVRFNFATFLLTAALGARFAQAQTPLHYVWRVEGTPGILRGLVAGLPGEAVATISSNTTVTFWREADGGFISTLPFRAAFQGGEYVGLQANVRRSEIAGWAADRAFAIDTASKTVIRQTSIQDSRHAACTNDGSFLATMSGHQVRVSGTGWTNNNIAPGSYLTFNYDDTELLVQGRRYALPTGTYVGTGGGYGTRPSLSRDGKYWVGPGQGGIYLTDAVTGLLAGFYASDAICGAIDPTNTYVVAGTETSVNVFRRVDGTLIASLPVQGYAETLDFNNDGSKMFVEVTAYGATGSDGVDVFSTTFWQHVGRFAESVAQQAAVHEASGRVFAVSSTGVFRVYDARTGNLLVTWSNQVNDNFGDLAVSSDGTTLIAKGFYKVYCFRTSDGALIWSQDYWPQIVRSVSIRPQSDEVAVCKGQLMSYQVQLLSLSNGTQVGTLGGNMLSWDLGFSLDGSVMYLAGHNYFLGVDEVKAIRRSDGVVVWTSPMDLLGASGAFSGDGRYLAVMNQAYEIVVLDLATGSVVSAGGIARRDMVTLFFSRDGRYLACRSGKMYPPEEWLEVLDWSTGAVLAEWRMLNNFGYDFAYLDAKNTIVAASEASLRAFRAPFLSYNVATPIRR